jgi:hypothetical protein
MKDLKIWTHRLQRLGANFLYEYRNRNKMHSNPPTDTRLSWPPDFNISPFLYHRRQQRPGHDKSLRYHARTQGTGGVHLQYLSDLLPESGPFSTVIVGKFNTK